MPSINTKRINTQVWMKNFLGEQFNLRRELFNYVFYCKNKKISSSNDIIFNLTYFILSLLDFFFIPISKKVPFCIQNQFF